MKILINGLSAKFGGGELYLQKLLENLKDENLDITLYCAPSFKAPEKSQIKKIIVSKKLSHPIIRPLWEIFSLPKILKNEKFDILFCPGGTSGTAPSKDYKTVITFQNMLPFSYETLNSYKGSVFYLKMKLLNIALKKSFKKADLCIFISHYAKNVVESIVGASLNAKTVIYHGVIKHQITSTQDDAYLLYVSVLTPYKNQIPVIKAFAQLKKLGLYPGKLVLAGKNDTTYGKQALNLANSLNLQDDIVFTGNLSADKLVPYYMNAEAYIFASECENCPNILLEKLYFNKPVATSNMGPMDEIAKERALYFNPRNENDIFNTLKILVSSKHKDNYKNLGEPYLNTWEQSASETWKEIMAISK